MTDRYRFELSCPECRGRLRHTAPDRLHCPSCDRSYRRTGGIWRLLSPDATQAEFLEHYRTVRAAEDWGSRDPAYFRNLPEVASNDPHASIWRIRRISFGKLQEELAGRRPQLLLDLGAGNGWLSHRLSSSGLTIAAIDLSDDVSDGLGACFAYGDPPGFLRLQASFDRLPIADASVDAVVFNGSLHYSTDLTRTLREALRVLSPTGWIAVMDTPFYRSTASGQAMLAERRQGWNRRFGSWPRPTMEGSGFLTPKRLEEATALGVNWESVPVPLGWRWGLKQSLRRTLGRPLLASFPLLIATRAQRGENPP